MCINVRTPWAVIDKDQISSGAWSWTLRRGSMTALVFEQPRDMGVRVIFTDNSNSEARAVYGRVQDLRAAAHTARCCAKTYDELADLAESGNMLDARPVYLGDNSLKIEGADALVALRFYFEKPFFRGGLTEAP